jgi:hypothetical protein
VTTGTERAALHQRDTHASFSTATKRHADQRGKISEVDIGVFSGGARHYHDAAVFQHTGQHSQPSIMQRYSCCTLMWLLVNATGG